MSDDHFAELQLIDFSRCQREDLERWFRALIDASQFEVAEEIRQELQAADFAVAA